RPHQASLPADAMSAAARDRAREGRHSMTKINSLLAAIAVATAAASFANAAPITAGTATRGGATARAKGYHVTSLADSGAGTLRAAVEASGPRFVVFDISGNIILASDLRITAPNITIAGQTAPKPGITLAAASLRVRASNVIIQHIAIRPGPGAT